MVGILLFGIIAGIVIGVMLSLLLLIGRASNPGVREADTDGAEMLSELAARFRAEEIHVVLALVESSISDLWERAGALETIGTPVFHTVSEAVDAVR